MAPRGFDKLFAGWHRALSRTALSAPARYFLLAGLLRGRVLDYGSGRGDLKPFGLRNVTEYDPYYQPVRPAGTFDTVYSGYVLNVLPEHAEGRVLDDIRSFLKPGGAAYVAVRRDLDVSRRRGQRLVTLDAPLVHENGGFAIYAIHARRSAPALRSARSFLRAVEALPLAKRMPDAVYVHVSALARVARELRDAVDAARALAGIPQGAFQVVKFSRVRWGLSLLAYPGFMVDPYPALAAAWTVDLGARSVREHVPGANPPILHRKETMLAPDHPRVRQFSALTADAERRGLFANPQAIGTRRAWAARLARGHAPGGH